ncbi:MAG: RnfABCDGE type electron transport complex subunit G [Bacteroidales bacterium]|nr:RnfABCDGE type electron transport complex subunit G [Bacteroidales bacterium]
MAKIKSSFKNMLIVLTSITCLSGAILGGVSDVTKDAISASKLSKQMDAIKLVAPEYDNNPIKDQWKVTLEDGTEAIIFPATKNGEMVGAAVQAMTKNGFGGPISIMAGFDKDGTIKEYTVLSHSETPGLGSKMPEWFHNKGNILGKNPSKDNLTVSKDGGDVDAITAATISSRAFLNAIANAYNAFSNSNDANSGATHQNTDKKEEGK